MIVWSTPALTTGAWFTGAAALTVIWISSLVLRAVSFAVSRSTYTPFVEKLARVFAVAALVNVTVPGPLTFVQATVSLFDGSPSSVAVPASVAVEGSVIVWARPALTTGAWFGGVAVNSHRTLST